MTWTLTDGAVLREWLEHHDNIKTAHVLAVCDKADLPHRTRCGARADYIVDFGSDSVGKHPRCRTHTVQVIRSWYGLEKRREAKT